MESAKQLNVAENYLNDNLKQKGYTYKTIASIITSSGIQTTMTENSKSKKSTKQANWT